MSFKHISFSDSAVMRELERLALEKDPKLIKKASIKEGKFTPNTTYHNILDLIASLRREGLVKDAEMLQEKAVLYKNAETHLYRAIDEDGEDLLNFAYPKEIEIAPATDGWGNIETPLSQHKKIVDIVMKNPKGASAKNNLLGKVAFDLGLVKKSKAIHAKALQELSEDLLIRLVAVEKEIPKYSISSKMTLYISVGQTWGMGGYSKSFLIATGKRGEGLSIKDDAAYGVFRMFAGQENVNEASRQYRNSIARGSPDFEKHFEKCIKIANNSIKTVFNNIKNTVQEVLYDPANISKIQKLLSVLHKDKVWFLDLWAGYDEEIMKDFELVIDQIHKVAPKAIAEIEAAIADRQNTPFVQALKPIFDDYKALKSNVLQWNAPPKYTNSKNGAEHYLQSLLSIIEDAINSADINSLINRLNSSNLGFQDINQNNVINVLKQSLQNTRNSFETAKKISTTSSINIKEITKKAQNVGFNLVPEEPTVPPPNKPIYSQEPGQTSTQKTPNSPKPANKADANAINALIKQLREQNASYIDAVQRMQITLLYLGKPDVLNQLKADPKEFSALSTVGQRNFADTPEGLWGPKTTAAVKAAKKLLGDNLNIPNIPENVLRTAGKNKEEQDKWADVANSIGSQIISYLQENKIATPEGLKASTTDLYTFDKVRQGSIGFEDGNVILTKIDLSSLDSFSRWLYTKLGLNPNGKITLDDWWNNVLTPLGNRAAKKANQAYIEAVAALKDLFMKIWKNPAMTQFQKRPMSFDEIVQMNQKIFITPQSATQTPGAPYVSQQKQGPGEGTNIEKLDQSQSKTIPIKRIIYPLSWPTANYGIFTKYIQPQISYDNIKSANLNTAFDALVAIQNDSTPIQEKINILRLPIKQPVQLGSAEEMRIDTAYKMFILINVATAIKANISYISARFVENNPDQEQFTEANTNNSIIWQRELNTIIENAKRQLGRLLSGNIGGSTFGY